MSLSSMSLVRPAASANAQPAVQRSDSAAGRRMIADAAWHSLLWLAVANVVGVLVAALLLWPGLNALLGEWTYGRWLMVHMNLELYGWSSLPLVAFLLWVYGAQREPTARWVSPVLWLWTGSLAIGSLSWLNGHSSGKLFLDWSGYARVLFPLALLGLWALLCWAFVAGRLRAQPSSRMALALKIAGLVLLLLVPVLLYVAANPAIYPPINPDTGGPTGASQLESVLVILVILLLLPCGLTARQPGPRRVVPWAWAIFALEAVLCLGLGRADVSHHRPTQWVSLGSLLVWIPLLPAYYGAFRWHPQTRRWRLAMLCWWAVLVPTGWLLFLPGVLDHFKFTDGLVAHSLLAMAGFVSSLLLFVLAELLGADAWIVNRRWSFWVWQLSVALYVAIMFYAGWREGSDVAWAIVPGLVRNSLYAVRLALGVLLLAASLDWLRDATLLLRQLHWAEATR